MIDCQSPMSALTATTAPAHVASLLAASKTSPFEPSASLVATEISDGNLNFAFCVADAANPSCAVFLKQAPGYIKVLGPAYELSAARLNLEAEVLQAYGAAATVGGRARAGDNSPGVAGARGAGAEHKHATASGGAGVGGPDAHNSRCGRGALAGSDSHRSAIVSAGTARHFHRAAGFGGAQSCSDQNVPRSVDSRSSLEL